MIARAWFAAMLATASLAGCGIPPVDTKFVSQTPAPAADLALARKAVDACTNISPRDEATAALKRAGFIVTEENFTVRRGRTLRRIIVDDPRDRVSVLLDGSSCYVGLVGMTPEQSYSLASVWARKHRAEPNSAFGDGLSDHVSGAWRRFFTEPARLPVKAPYKHRIYIAAYKTWPSGPYDPQRNVAYDIEGLFPDRPGAAVKITHAIECDPIVSTGSRSGAFLPCSGPDYRAK